jgi:hypothetical protein
MKGFAYFEFNKADLKRFTASCEATIRNVGRGTKQATIDAARAILNKSLEQVPRDTETLASSAFFSVNRRMDTAETTWAYEAIIGYGGNGDPINPDTGRHASEYMVAVHERLDVRHPVGKAKFLEDPMREFGAEILSNEFSKNIRNALK